MTVQDILDAYIAEASYVTHSMINKSYDDLGCAYKWLCQNAGGAFRREVFIATTTTEEAVEDRTVDTYVEINDAK